MSDRSVRMSVALGAAAAILVFAGWLDGQVFQELRRRGGITFEIGPLAWALPFGYLVVAASVLAVGSLAWWSRSLLVGGAYALVGAFFAFLFTIMWQFAAQRNEAPPVLPQPLPGMIGDIYDWGIAHGSLNALSTIGAAMLLSGLATIALGIRRKIGGRSRPGPAVITRGAA